jgi:antirestriction protein
MTMRAWIGCLASYNNGRLHGEWFDVSTDADENAANVEKVLCNSPFPNVTRVDPETGAAYATAEEAYIGDYDGPAEMARQLGEYAGAQALADAAQLEEAISERFSDADEIAAVLSQMLDGTSSVDLGDLADNAEEWISDHYAGEGNTLADWCAEFLEETDFFGSAFSNDKTSDRRAAIQRYFDFESYARDMQLGGEISTERVNSKVLVFWNR